jgi:hypothetical protein
VGCSFPLATGGTLKKQNMPKIKLIDVIVYFAIVVLAMAFTFMAGYGVAYWLDHLTGK